MSTASLAMAWLQLLALLAAEIGLVALAVALARHWCRSAAWRRTLCQAGVAAVMAVTACELSGSARELGSWAAGKLAWSQRDPLPEPSAPQQLVVPVAPPRQPSPSAVQASQAAVDSMPAPRIAAQLARTPRHVPESAVAAASKPGSDSMGPLWLCLVWAAGAALAGVRLCVAQCLLLVFRLRRPIAAPALAQRVQTLARALGIRRRVRVIESGRLTGPIAFGLIRPTVGLPSDFAGRFDAARQDAMLAHELAHLAAHDPFWCWLADVTTVLLWWHPGVWWLRRQLHLASEMAADEASLLVADGPRVLAECLVELGTRLTRPALLGQLRVSGFRSHLGRRVQQLVHLEGRVWAPPPRLRAALVKILGPIAITAIVMLCTAWAAPQAIKEQDTMKTIKLSWKHSLATVALLAAFNGPETGVAVADSGKTDAPTAPPPVAATPEPGGLSAPAGTSAAAEDPATPKPPPVAADAADVFARRYGIQQTGIPAVKPRGDRLAEKSTRGAKIEAKLKQINLPQIAFDGLPLSEVLKILADESIKRDPEKQGVNFLINPNPPPPAFTAAVDPRTGLPVAAPAEQVDVYTVTIKFSLPLRNVTLKDVLDAIVTVADYPIEYSLQDFGVVFSAKPQTVGEHPVTSYRPVPAPFSRPGVPPMMQGLQASPPNPPEVPTKPHRPKPELMDVMPQTFNIDFGSGPPSEQTGPAAAGKAGDYWNTVSVGFNDHHTASELLFAGGEPSPIQVEMINLGGGWKNTGGLGLQSPMLDTYNYPTGNRGGNSTVILHYVPPGKYSVYLYGFGPTRDYYGDYTLTVGSRDYGRKMTYQKKGSIHDTKWIEGLQYVKFTNVKVAEGEKIEVLIQPGKVVTEPSGRSFADGYICGLQLIPMK